MPPTSRTADSHDLERALIGCLLINPARLPEVAAIVEPAQMVDRLLAACYRAMLVQAKAKRMVEPVTVLRMVRESDVPLSESAAKFIADAGVWASELARHAVTDLHAVHYAREVAMVAIRRQLSAKASAMHSADDDEERQKLADEISELSRKASRIEGISELSTLDVEVAKYIEGLERRTDTLVQLGLPGIDSALGGGVALGELVVIGARPSHGKTLVAMQCVEELAEQGMKALVISEEMSKQLLAERALSHMTDIRRDYWSDHTEDLREDAHEFFQHRSAIYIAESVGTVKAAVSEIERAAANGVRVVAVDYAQLLRGKGDTQYERVTDVSNQMKQVAKRLNLVVLLLCQLSRAGSGRKEYKEACREYPRGVIPTMTDCRDSGYIEQDADVIIMLQWPLRYESKYKPGDEYFMYVKKNRNRPTYEAEIRCRIEPSRQRLLATNYDSSFEEYQNFQEE